MPLRHKAGLVASDRSPCRHLWPRAHLPASPASVVRIAEIGNFVTDAARFIGVGPRSLEVSSHLSGAPNAVQSRSVAATWAGRECHGLDGCLTSPAAGLWAA